MSVNTSLLIIYLKCVTMFSLESFILTHPVSKFASGHIQSCVKVLEMKVIETICDKMNQ